MRTVSFAEAEYSLNVLLDSVMNDADTVLISRRDAEDAVLMSLNYYNSLMETLYLLRSTTNAEHLNRSIAQFKAAQANHKT